MADQNIEQWISSEFHLPISLERWARSKAEQYPAQKQADRRRLLDESRKFAIFANLSL